MKINLDEGYQFGLGAFETIAVKSGEPVFLDWHLERLNHSLDFLKLNKQIDADLVFSYLKDEKRNLKYNVPDYALKIMVSGENTLFTVRENPYREEHYQKGFRLDYSQVFRNETSPLVYHKTMNYGDCILEKRKAISMGIDELIFRNSRGEICEGTTTNLFFVKNKEVFTPAVSCGLLPGVMRRFVMSVIPVREEILKKEDIEQMEECFVTNSLMGIMPVSEITGITFRSRETAKRLRKML